MLLKVLKVQFKFKMNIANVYKKLLIGLVLDSNPLHVIFYVKSSNKKSKKSCKNGTIKIFLRNFLRKHLVNTVT